MEIWGACFSGENKKWIKIRYLSFYNAEEKRWIMPQTPDGGWLLDDSEITKFEPPKKKEKKKIKKPKEQGKKKN